MAKEGYPSREAGSIASFFSSSHFFSFLFFHFLIHGGLYIHVYSRRFAIVCLWSKGFFWHLIKYGYKPSPHFIINGGLPWYSLWIFVSTSHFKITRVVLRA